MHSLTIVRQKKEWDSLWDQVNTPVYSSIYATQRWVKNSTRLDKGTAELAVFRNDNGIIIHPYIRRDIPNTRMTDITSAFDFGGFWMSTQDPKHRQELMEGFCTHFDEYAWHNGIVSEFIRVFPWSTPPPAEHYNSTLVRDNVVIDLGLPPSRYWDGFSPSLRNNLRRSEESGLTVRITSMKKFMYLYHQSTRDKGRDPYFLFPRPYFNTLMNKQGDSDTYCLGAYDLEGNLRSAHLYIIDGTRLFYFLSASNPTRLQHHPNHAIIWAIMNHFRSGFDYLYLGGGRPESLMRFKESFSPNRIPYYISTRVFDQEAYEYLEKAGESFPAYRKDLI